MADQDDPLKDQTVIERAVDFMKRSEEADTQNRIEALEDIRFRDGQQWPMIVMQSRELEKRPCLTINKVDSYITQVENQQRQQRPRIKVDPVGSGATKKVSDVIQGLIRHIENNRGGGDLAYDNGFSGAATAGVGYWRILADYCREDCFEQDLYLAPIENQFSVYYDPQSIWPDGSDAEECLISSMMGKKEFKRKYPKASDGANFTQTAVGDSFRGWVEKDEIRIAEYYYIESTHVALYHLTNGKTFWEDNRPEGVTGEITKGLPIAPGIMVDGKRMSWRRQLKWCKLTAMDILERRDLSGKFIPVVPVYGKTSVVDGKRKRKGLVRNARDPARMSNYWKTAATESVALAPKAKWVMAEGQDEGYENDWASANVSAKATLKYKQTDINGQPVANPPQRLQPEPPPDGILSMIQGVDQDLSAVLGIIDPAVRIGGNVSGKALNAERQQSDNSTFNFYDNLTRSMAQTGRILLDLIPYYYSEPSRVVRIIGDDGNADSKTLNQPHPDPAVETVLNDVTTGEYDVVMDTGPGYSTKRQEAVARMAPLFEKNEQLMQIAGDIFFRNMDGPGSDVIADRMAAANPMSDIDKESDVPPKAQMLIKQQQQQLQQAQQAIQQLQMTLKFRGDIEGMRQDGETKRTLMKATADTHIEDRENRAWMRDVDTQAATKRHDTETRALTAIQVAEINNAGKLLDSRMGNEHDMKRLDKESEQAERQLKMKSNQTEKQ